MPRDVEGDSLHLGQAIERLREVIAGAGADVQDAAARIRAHGRAGVRDGRPDARLVAPAEEGFAGRDHRGRVGGARAGVAAQQARVPLPGDVEGVAGATAQRATVEQEIPAAVRATEVGDRLVEHGSSLGTAPGPSLTLIGLTTMLVIADSVFL